MTAIQQIPELTGKAQQILNMLCVQDQQFSGEWVARNAVEFEKTIGNAGPLAAQLRPLDIAATGFLLGYLYAKGQQYNDAVVMAFPSVS